MLDLHPKPVYNSPGKQSRSPLLTLSGTPGGFITQVNSSRIAINDFMQADFRSACFYFMIYIQARCAWKIRAKATNRR